ncbi:MAG: dependent oxidoreductase [Gemmatimonadetes bacterium]|nr:dependent oxidoreductase [Gemmatimonadota bacterium]
MSARAELVICGAGIAGVAAAYHLAVRQRVRGVVLVDEREPLTLTSDKGTQGYRNWWPGPDDTMLRFVSRSIDLLEEIADETTNLFRLNRRGYLFATAEEDGVERLRSTARQVSSYGMGPLREHSAPGAYEPAPAEGFRDQPVGADLLLDDEALRAFPLLSRTTKAALHVRRAGWMNAVALGAWMMKQSMAAGVTFVRDGVSAIDTQGGRVSRVRLSSGASIDTDRVVLATGPMLPHSGRLLGIELPLFHELHAKVTFADTLGIIPRSSPFTIWIDEVDGFPGGVHVRPIDGPRGNELFFIWTFHTEPIQPVWPPTFDARYGEVCLRGLAAMAPRMSAYLDRPERGYVDGGYYCKTTDNRPLVGPLPVEGAFIIGGLSGTGIMTSQSAAELLAAHVTQAALPDWSNAFVPTRYDDPAYVEQSLRAGALTGQL